MSRKMKDSGVELIGLIPEEWSAVRLKYLCRIQTGEEDTQDANEDGEYPFYVRSPFIERSTKYTFDGEGVLVAGDGAGAGRVFHHAFGKYAVHQRVYRLSDFRCHTRFLYNYLICIFPYEMDRGSAQSTVPSIRLPMLQNFRVLIPPTKMSGIANFLDTKCAEIDKVVEKTRESIEEYKKLKQAVITEAVTKGVRGPRPMKPSGVEWIGDIPEEWTVTKYKYISFINPKCNLSELSLEDGVSFAPMECVKKGYHTAYRTEVSSYSSSYSVFEENDIVMAKVTPCFENGNIAIMSDLINQRGFGSSELIVLRSRDKCEKFLFYSLQNFIFKDHACSTMQGTGGLKRVSPNWIANYILPLPPVEERNRIAAFLDVKCGEIDRLISKKEQLITELETYKKSLIYEYVTGKKEVPV